MELTDVKTHKSADGEVKSGKSLNEAKDKVKAKAKGSPPEGPACCTCGNDKVAYSASGSCSLCEGDIKKQEPTDADDCEKLYPSKGGDKPAPAPAPAAAPAAAPAKS